MTNHEVKNGRRKFLLAVGGGIAGLAAWSSPARVLAQPAGGPPVSISTIGAGRMGGALGTLFVKAGHRVMFSSRHPDTLKGLLDELGPLARVGTVADAVEFGCDAQLVQPSEPEQGVAGDDVGLDVRHVHAQANEATIGLDDAPQNARETPVDLVGRDLDGHADAAVDRAEERATTERRSVAHGAAPYALPPRAAAVWIASRMR